MLCSVSDKNITLKKISSIMEKYMLQRNFVEVLRNKNRFSTCICHKKNLRYKLQIILKKEFTLLLCKQF